MNNPSASSHSSNNNVDAILFRIRWILLLLALVAAWVDNGLGLALPTAIWVWFGITVTINTALGLANLFQRLRSGLPVIGLVADSLLFGLLPYLVPGSADTLVFFTIFPVIVAAVRFGSTIGYGITILESLALAIHTFIGWYLQSTFNPFFTIIPPVISFTISALVGNLIQTEKQVQSQYTEKELDELRTALEGARLLYNTSDALNFTTNYQAVFAGMLEAGVRGLPTARSSDGPPTGIVLVFDDKKDQRLHIAASRNLDKRDADTAILGDSGIVAETLKSGKPTVFSEIRNDPELSAFIALARCHGGVCYPLQAGLEQYGVVVLATPAPRLPSEQHLELMRAFTNQAGVVFQNAKLYQATRMEQDKMIRDENELRQKLARDLHDGPTQKVAALVMQLDYISRLMDENPTEAKKEITQAREIAQQTVKEIRTALFTLRPLALESNGLSAALVQYGDRLRQVEKINIQVEPGDFGTELDLNIASAVFSIIDEAVNNARKHASHSLITVHAYRQESTLVAIIQDQGPGFDLTRVLSSYDKKASLGLQNMKDRAALVNGELRIETQPGRGTRIMLIVPLIPKENSGVLS